MPHLFFMIKETLLPNNINLVTETVSTARTVAVGFYYSVGSRFEGPGERGISHFCEHLLFKGTGRFSRREISCTFDRMGGTLNAFTERDDVCVYAVFPSSEENFSHVMDILCSMDSDCIFPECEIEKERCVVENEIRAVEDDPEESSLDALAESVWGGCSLGQTITGTVDDVEKLDSAKIRDWYERFFVHGKLTVYVTGNFDLESAESWLGKLQLHARNEKIPADGMRVWNRGPFFIGSKFGQRQIYVSSQIKRPFDEKSYWAMTVFNALCGDTMSSRMFEVLREKNGLCYSVYSFFSCYEDNGIWSCYASCDGDGTEKALSLMMNELDSILKDGFSDSEISDAKGHLCGEEIMGEGDMEYVMRRLQKSHSLGLPLYSTDEILSSIRAVEKNDIMDLAREILQRECRTVLVYGKKLNRKRLEKVIL